MDITSQVDPMYWGVMLSTVIFGINIAQGWVYVNTNNDPWHLRLLVAVIFILDLVTTCLNYQFLRYYLMSNYGNPIAFLELIPSVIAVIVTTISIAYLTQIFVVSRIYLRA
ncbi:hypothetical protein L208DRAFT_1391438 [Tricholoma matsutake]|nr:hypothetical protein L208DRAFT_1391438 [Tricholoma matsutake 945]